MTGTAEKVGADSPGGGRGSRAHTALGRFGEDAAARWLADRGYVMDSGEITMTGPGKQLLVDPKVREAYLGH